MPRHRCGVLVRTASAEYRGRHDANAGVAMDDLEGSENPVAAHAAAQRAALLKALLSQMPVARDREILARFYLREEDRDVVCRALGIEASHFHRVVHRARERFRQLLDQAGLSEM